MPQLLPRAAEKAPVETDAQLVPSQRQPAKPLRRPSVRAACFKTPNHPPEAQLHRRLRIVFTEPMEAFLNLSEQPHSLADNARRRFQRKSPVTHGLQHGAVEFPAAPRTRVINATAAATEAGAGLWQAGLAAGGFRRQAERLQPRRIVGWLEFDIAEQPAIAAEAALKAERLQAGARHSHVGAAGA